VWGEEKHKMFCGGILKGRKVLEDQGEDGNITLKGMLKK
jgi:hypothetical protein